MIDAHSAHWMAQTVWSGLRSNETNTAIKARLLEDPRIGEALVAETKTERGRIISALIDLPMRSYNNAIRMRLGMEDGSDVTFTTGRECCRAAAALSGRIVAKTDTNVPPLADCNLMTCKCNVSRVPGTAHMQQSHGVPKRPSGAKAVSQLGGQSAAPKTSAAAKKAQRAGLALGKAAAKGLLWLLKR